MNFHQNLPHRARKLQHIPSARTPIIGNPLPSPTMKGIPFLACWEKCWGFLTQKVCFQTALKAWDIFFCQQKFGQNPGESKGVVCFLATDPKHVVVSCCVLRSFAKSGFATHTEQFQLYQCHSETRCSLLVQGNTELSSSNLVNVWLAR